MWEKIKSNKEDHWPEIQSFDGKSVLNTLRPRNIEACV